MAESIVSTNHAVKPAKPGKGRKPPDERSWQRYTEHYEFPISSAGSVVLHGLAIGLLVLGGILAAKLGFNNDVPPIETINIGGGGGNPEGVGNGPGVGVVPAGEETAQQTKPPPKVVAETAPREELKPAENKAEPLLKENDPTATRTTEDVSAVVGQLSEIGKRARERIAGQVAGKGRGGSGEGGGRGKGKGTGRGDLEGPGNAKITQRDKRQLRWTMLFDTPNGRDYLVQLDALGAILAVPAPDGGYLVIRDLLKKPVEPKPEDLATLDRIYWIDDRPSSVASLAKTLGIATPDHIAVFFPVKLEQELLDKELRRFRGKNEDDILETRFRVRKTRSGYEIEVMSQRTK